MLCIIHTLFYLALILKCDYKIDNKIEKNLFSFLYDITAYAIGY